MWFHRNGADGVYNISVVSVEVIPVNLLPTILMKAY
jgi:hypothetical protein